MTYGKKRPLRAALQRLRLNMREHPAFPFIGRAIAYGMLLLLVLVLATALKDSPLRGYSALCGAVLALFLSWKINRALKRARRIMDDGKPERPGLFRRMASEIEQAKKNL